MFLRFIIFPFLCGIPFVLTALIDDFKLAWTGITAAATFYPSIFEQRVDNFARDINRNSTSVPSPRGQCLLFSDSFLGSNATSNRGSGSEPITSDVHPTSTITSAATSASAPSSIWKAQKMHVGDSFFDEWSFFVGSDPTHGNVEYVDQNTALSASLVSINSDGNAVMSVNTTQTISGNRPSIRITTNYQFTGGLLILDALHAPTGCATWPAFWTNGADWPNNGEIDIMEGVNDLTINQASIHTAPGCQISNSESENGATGTLVGGNNCASAESNNGGCGQQASSLSNTYGPGFNQNGGGVYAMLWDETGIAVYFFSRQQIPQDISSQAPQPQNWGSPFARWPASNCNPFQFFQQHSAIFDITLCGDWAGNVWDNAGSPGQETSCAQRTGFSTCADFVENMGSSFEDAYWEIRSVTLYQKDM